jgi:hypothetical protein
MIAEYYNLNLFEKSHLIEHFEIYLFYLKLLVDP